MIQRPFAVFSRAREFTWVVTVIIIVTVVVPAITHPTPALPSLLRTVVESFYPWKLVPDMTCNVFGCTLNLAPSLYSHDAHYITTVLITRKSPTDFRLIPSSMTLNDLERRSCPYFAFFTEFDSFAGQLRHTGWTVKYCLPVPLFHFWPTHPAAWSLCDSWVSCLHLYLLRLLASGTHHLNWVNTLAASC